LFKYILIVLLFVNLICIGSLKAKDKPEIIWLIEDSKENSTIGTPLATNTSTSTYTEDLILSGLTNYKIELQRVSMKRIDAQLKSTRNACVASRIKTKKRETYSIYSSPQNIYLSHKIYRLANEKPLSPNVFNENGDIKSLYALFSHYQDKTLAIADAVSYGLLLDEQIAHLKPKTLYNRGGGRRILAINEMLFKSRVDFILYYPTEINILTPKSKKLESYHIAGSEPFILGYFTCSKSKLGEQVILDINKLLSSAYLSKAFYHAHSRWLLPSDIQKLNRYYIKIFGKHSFIK